MLEQISIDLPNFPNEVISDWLLPFAVNAGWPPSSERWNHLLTITDTNYWRSFGWDQSDIDINNIQLTEATTERINKMLDWYLNDAVNEYTIELGPQSQHRFHFQLHYLIDNGRFPKPLILVNHGNGYELMDGNHRLCALLAWQILSNQQAFLNQLGKPHTPFSVVQPAWLATIN